MVNGSQRGEKVHGQGPCASIFPFPSFPSLATRGLADHGRIWAVDQKNRVEREGDSDKDVSILEGEVWKQKHRVTK